MTNSKQSKQRKNSLYKMFLYLSVLSLALFAMWSQLALKPHYDYSKVILESEVMTKSISNEMVEKTKDINGLFFLTPNNIEKVAIWQIEIISEILANNDELSFEEKKERLSESRALTTEAKMLHYEMWNIQITVFLMPIFFFIVGVISRVIRSKKNPS